MKWLFPNETPILSQLHSQQFDGVVQCTDRPVFSVGPLPSLAQSMGFVRNPIAYHSHGKFTAMPGPKEPDPSISPLGALQKLMDKQVVNYFLKRTRAALAGKYKENSIDNCSFWRYFIGVLGHGIVKYAEERDAYVAEKSSIHGLLSNNLLRSLHTFSEWQEAKQLFTGTRNDLTIFFNKASQSLWVPSQ